MITPLLLISLVTNLAVLISPLFMMQVLDRVVPSGNLNTLMLLLAIALAAIATNALLEMSRDIAFARLGCWVEAVSVRQALQIQPTQRQDVIDNIAQLRGFFKSPTATHSLNLPFIPLFLIALALIHPLFLILVAAVVGGVFALKLIVYLASKDRAEQNMQLHQREQNTLRDALHFAQDSGITAIGDNLGRAFQTLQTDRHKSETALSSLNGMEKAGAGFLRMASQLLALSLGAALVVRSELSAGGMIGASIIAAKTIGVIEGSFAHLPDMRKTLGALRSLRQDLKSAGDVQTEVMALSGAIKAHDLIFPRGGGAPPRLERISMELNAGECLAIVGDSGSGKTTLLHALCGVDPSPIGAVFLDETEVKTLGPETTKAMIGYLPQQARMLPGTIAQNIACFDPSADDEKVIKAAKIAGVHGLISSLPNAYQADVGKEPYLLSAGQKQRVALARAIYQEPRYLFLDEPNALLDAQGERQLCDTLALLKSNGTTIVMVLHRSGIMGLADKVLLLDHGRMADFGPRGEVLGRMNDGRRRITLPLNTAALQDLNDWIRAQFVRSGDLEFCQKSILVGTEMFNAALQNGPSDVSRNVTITFKFVSDSTCSLKLTEEIETEAAAKMEKIQSLLRHPEVNMLDLPADEIALAVVAQLSDELEVSNVENTALFKASISSDRVMPDGVTTH